jgi:hypothetical protein
LVFALTVGIISEKKKENEDPITIDTVINYIDENKPSKQYDYEIILRKLLFIEENKISNDTSKLAKELSKYLDD